MKPEPLKYKILLAEEVFAEYDSKTQLFKTSDVKSAVKFLDEQLNSLCCDPPLSYDDFMERKKRIINYCFPDMIE